MRDVVLITGISGNLGRALARLLHRSERVAGLDRRPFEGRPKDLALHQLVIRKRKVVMMANRSHLPKGMWDFNIGGTEEEVLRYLELLADTQQVHWGHYSLFKVAEVDGVPAAGMCGFFENELGPVSMGGPSCAASPSGAPASDHCEMIAICSSVSERSST